MYGIEPVIYFCLVLFVCLFLLFVGVNFCYAGVKTEEIRKGRHLVGLRDVWRVFLEILPLHK